MDVKLIKFPETIFLYPDMPDGYNTLGLESSLMGLFKLFWMDNNGYLLYCRKHNPELHKSKHECVVDDWFLLDTKSIELTVQLLQEVCFITDDSHNLGLYFLSSSMCKDELIREIKSVVFKSKKNILKIINPFYGSPIQEEDYFWIKKVTKSGFVISKDHDGEGMQIWGNFPNEFNNSDSMKFLKNLIR